MACSSPHHNQLDCPSGSMPIELWCGECRRTFGVTRAIGAVPLPMPTPLPAKISKPRFNLTDLAAVEELATAALDVVMDADLVDGEWFGKLVDPDKIDRLERAVEGVQR